MSNENYIEKIYPSIVEYVVKISTVEARVVDRDEIGFELLKNSNTKSIVEESIYAKTLHVQIDEYTLWKKAGNFVDWLNADITQNASRSRDWNGDFFIRGKVKRRSPFTGKMRLITALRLNQLLEEDIKTIFEVHTRNKTERQQLVLNRIGQGKFRQMLVEYWRRQCALTGCNQVEILRASHIKPWRVCTNEERLDPFNGFLFVPNVDAVFDRGLITFRENGLIMISNQLSAASQLGITPNMQVILQDEHQQYLDYHRENVFLHS